MPLAKKWIVLLAVPILLLMITATASAYESPRLLHELFNLSLMQPERVEEVLYGNRRMFDDRFIRCLERILDRYYYSIKKNNPYYCRELVFRDPAGYFGCFQTRPKAYIALWSESIWLALRRNQRWSRTLFGREAYIAKRNMSSNYGPRAYTNIIMNEILPTMTRYLRCE